MNLLDKTIDADLAAIELEREQLQTEIKADSPRQQRKPHRGLHNRRTEKVRH